MARYFIAWQPDPEATDFRDPKAKGQIVHETAAEAIDAFLWNEEDDLAEVAAEYEHHDPDREHLSLWVFEHDGESVIGSPIEYRIDFERSYSFYSRGPAQAA